MTRERAWSWVSSITLQVLTLGGLSVSPLLNYEALPEPQDASPRHRYVRVTEIPKAPAGSARKPSGNVKPSVGRAFGVLAAPGEIPDRILDDAVLFSEGGEGVDFGIPFGVPQSGGGLLPIEGPPKAPPEPVRVGGNVTAPRKRRHVNPIYPPIATAARIQGTVILEATIDENGRVVNLRVLRSIPLLDAAAIEAVREWSYEPTLLNGSPVPILMSVSVRFELGR